MAKVRFALLLMTSSFFGAAVLWVFQGHSLEIIPSTMSYSDFVAILLTVLSALVAVIGLALAIFALWGWAQFRKGVESKIIEITPRFLANELKEGGTRQVLDGLVIDFFRAELAKPGVAEAWAAERDKKLDELDELDKAPRED